MNVVITAQDAVDVAQRRYPGFHDINVSSVGYTFETVKGVPVQCWHLNGHFNSVVITADGQAFTTAELEDMAQGIPNEQR